MPVPGGGVARLNAVESTLAAEAEAPEDEAGELAPEAEAEVAEEPESTPAA